MTKSEVDTSDLWASDETRKFDVVPGVWVEIKEELDHGEEQAMQAAAMKGITRQQLVNAVDDGDSQDVILMDSARLHFLKLAFYLVDWNLKDEQGRGITLPSRVDDRIKILKRLKPKFGQRISDEIDKLREEKAKELEDPNAPSAQAQTETGTTAMPTTDLSQELNGTTPVGDETQTEAISSSPSGWAGT